MPSSSADTSSAFGLTADIGGTNVRFALVDLEMSRRPMTEPEQLAVRDYADVFAAARDYLDRRNRHRPLRSAAFAVAGPVRAGEIHFTNSGWHISETEMRRALNVSAAHLVNDFEAVARAVPFLSQDDLLMTGGPSGIALQSDGVVTVLGPGTGLGVAVLASFNGRCFPLAGEGGHASFAPSDELEIEILKVAQRKYGHVSSERILSGSGLQLLYTAMGEVLGTPAGPVPLPEQITAEARSDASSFSAAVFERFCAILGSVAGDLALVMGARKGVLLAGGILLDMRDQLAASAFRARFEAKGRFRSYLAEIPTALILDPLVGLKGAATLL